MKIKLFSILTITASCVYAQMSTAPTPTWKATLKVVDETGQPVAGATAIVDYNEEDQMTGLTDTNGIFIASHTDKSFGLAFLASKEGYYSFRQNYDMGFDYQYNFAKWNPTQIIILRKIGNPIPMYAKQAHAKFQQEDKPMGFDLEAGDWVTPLGKGFHTDIIFNLLHRQITGRLEYDCYLTVTFPNKGDGIAVAPSEPDTGSEFRTSRTAAESSYEPELDLHYSNTNQPPGVFGYFIRVHTELDQDGNVKSALYGKIDGNFRFYAGTIKPTSGMGFTYYLNPTPNDKNVEFNPKKNLVKDLKPLEQVKEP
jgi:hypothetical protein